MENNNKIQLEVIGLSHSPNMGNTFALVLQELNGDRRIPIVVGEPEAQSVVVVLEKIISQRPMTHDLFVMMCVVYNIELSEVIIYKLDEGIFYSKLVLEDYKGDLKEIDSRTSDAISLALRFECPINIYESIMERASIEITENTTIKPVDNDKNIIDGNVKKLEKTLEEAVRLENYEKAAKIRDLLGKRKN